MKASEIADLVGGELHGDPEAEISSVADISSAASGQMAFFEKDDDLPETGAECLIVPLGFTIAKSGPSVIKVRNPKLAFARAAAILHPPKSRAADIHPAIVSNSASVGKNVFIDAFTCIGERSTVGDDTQIRAGAKIGDGVS